MMFQSDTCKYNNYEIDEMMLKEVNLNPEDLKYFRPVSNLSFVSKLIERVVVSRLEQHMNHEDLYEPFQPVYRKGHSTETALLKIMDGLLRAMHRRDCILVALLDPSTTFDTVDVSHTILLQRLYARLGLSGSALAWLTSYLVYRVVHKPPQPKAQCWVHYFSVSTPCLWATS